MARNIATGIDIGTSQIKVVIAESGRSRSALPRIIGTGFAESRGMRHGYVVSEQDIVRSIRSAIVSAEKASGEVVRRAFLSVGGIGLDELYASGETIISRGDSEVSELDIERAITDAEERVAGRLVNKKLLHAIPLRYRIDGNVVLGRPRGMKGTKLSIDALFVTTIEQHLHDLVAAVEAAGISVEDVMASPLAGSLVMLTKAQKIAGCVLANIGSETVSIAVFENGVPISIKVFPTGSTDITNDIALGLKVSLDEAEQIKRGAVSGASYSRKRLDDLIEVRLAHIFSMIENHLTQLGKNEMLPAGIILTGGGSGLVAVESLARATLRLPSKVAALQSQDSKGRGSSWAVAYGLCLWGLTGEGDGTGIRLARHAGSSVIVALKDWVKQFLP
jgi:cell division protein FtsA